jgi:hypothetical protein
MHAARCGDGGPAAAADFMAALRPVAHPGALAAAASDSATDAHADTIAITAGIAAPGSRTASGATPATRAAATTSGQHRTYRQSHDREDQHEQSKYSHDAPPPWIIWIAVKIRSIGHASGPVAPRAHPTCGFQSGKLLRV